MGAPEFWLIAGPNGAGKTTTISSPFVRNKISHVRFLNADDRTLEKIRAAYRADRCYVFDNSHSSEAAPPYLIAQAIGGKLDIFDPDAIPAITSSLRAAFAAGY